MGIERDIILMDGMDWRYVGTSKEDVMEKIKSISILYTVYDAPYGMIALTIGKKWPSEFIKELDSAGITFDRMYTHCDANTELNEWKRDRE